MKKTIYKKISELKTFAFIITFAILIIGLSACERIPEIMQPSTEDQRNEVSIGLVLPLTGHLAAAGKLMKEGYDLALDEINTAQLANTQLKFIVKDDNSTPEGAVEVFNELIHEDGVSVIIGPASSSATKAAFPVARDNQIVAISSTSGARGLGAISDYVFRIPLTTDVVTARGIKATHAKLGYQRVATLYDKTDLFSTDRDTALQEAFTANNIDVLTTETFQSGDTDFSEQLTRIKEGNPDAVFVSALPPEKPGILIQARELGISVPIIISSLTDVEVQAAGALLKAQSLSSVGSQQMTHPETKPSFRSIPQPTAWSQMHLPQHHTQPSIFWQRQLRMHHQPIQLQSETHSRTSKTLTQFLANSLLMPMEMQSMNRKS